MLELNDYQRGLLVEMRDMAMALLDQLTSKERRDAFKKLREIHLEFGLPTVVEDGELHEATYDDDTYYYIIVNQVKDDYLDLFGPLLGKDIEQRIDNLVDAGYDPDDMNVHLVLGEPAGLDRRSVVVVINHDNEESERAMSVYPSFEAFETAMGGFKGRHPGFYRLEHHEDIDLDVWDRGPYEFGNSEVEFGGNAASFADLVRQLNE